MFVVEFSITFLADTASLVAVVWRATGLHLRAGFSRLYKRDAHVLDAGRVAAAGALKVAPCFQNAIHFLRRALPATLTGQSRRCAE